jgi:hypothetical protein
MNIVKRISMCLLLGFGLMQAEAYGAVESVGMIADNEGGVRFVYGGAGTPVELGAALTPGDRLTLDADGRIVIVMLADCEEFSIRGKDEILIEKTRVRSRRSGYLKPDRRLPVCYNSEDFDAPDSGVIGGFVMRGDLANSLADMRAEASKASADTTTLITLILHDIRNNQASQARPYYDELKKRRPDSAWVRKLEKQFSH